jgi:hypothetical protein
MVHATLIPISPIMYGYPHREDRISPYGVVKVHVSDLNFSL